MGVRFHRSKEILPGVRLNFSKRGMGISFGKKGMRYTISPNGTTRTTVGIPGTGLSYTSVTSSKKRKAESEAEEHPVYIPQSEHFKDPDFLIKKLSSVDPDEIIAKSNLQLWAGIAIGVFVDVIAIHQMFFK